MENHSFRTSSGNIINYKDLSETMLFRGDSHYDDDSMALFNKQHDQEDSELGDSNIHSNYDIPVEQEDEKTTSKKKKKRKSKPKEAPVHTSQENALKSSLTAEMFSQVSPEDKRFQDSQEKPIDYVLVYKNKTLDEANGDSERKHLERKRELRERFHEAMKNEYIEIQEDVVGENVFVKLHTTFWRLCREAERMKVEMPLHGCQIYDDEPGMCGWMDRFKDKYLTTDDEADFVSAPYKMTIMHIYEGHEDPVSFFRPGLRSLLTHHILINMDIRNQGQSGVEEDEAMAKKGLPYLLHKGVYIDAFTLHDESIKDPFEKELKEQQGIFEDKNLKEKNVMQGSQTDLMCTDARKELNDTWITLYKFQPLWKIRNYFGEKIAFYFAWTGLYITSLWLPMLLGLAIFIYGLFLSVKKQIQIDAINQNATDTQNVIDAAKSALSKVLNIIKMSCDNEITPYFAIIISFWGTIFLEMWKRKSATLAYEWDVDSFQDTEPDRPQFFGVKQKPDPVTQELSWYYPIYRYFLKFCASGSVLIVMVCCVCISVAAVIVYRVVMLVEYCGNLSGVVCMLLTTVVSSVLNAVSILILGKLYDFIAVKLTDWENHRTQTLYDNALIIKLFAFQFANCYTSLFYIAFFRKNQGPNGIFGLGPQYSDSCDDDNCMAMLSFQVLILMIMKPLPKFLKDVILPNLKKLFRRIKRGRHANKVASDLDNDMLINNYVERERLKPVLGDFTLGEYTEKVIMYGYIMLFAASLPIAPLIAFIATLIDIRVDGKRLLWMNRRPVSLISSNIGMWYSILQLLNICGVVSNAFLIAFTSSFGESYTTEGKLWFVIIFEHVAFAIKFLFMWMIPDVPAKIALNMRREKYQVAKILELAVQTRSDKNTEMIADRKYHFNRAMKELQTDVCGSTTDLRSIPPEAKLESGNRRGIRKRMSFGTSCFFDGQRDTSKTQELSSTKPQSRPDIITENEQLKSARFPMPDEDAYVPEKKRSREKLHARKLKKSTSDDVPSSLTPRPDMSDPLSYSFAPRRLKPLPVISDNRNEETEERYHTKLQPLPYLQSRQSDSYC